MKSRSETRGGAIVQTEQPEQLRATEFPSTYAENVYAGVLGKIVGVYLGRPFEGWRSPRIVDELGEINYYVNNRRDVELKNYRLVVPDDDITGMLLFPRVLRDYPVDQFDATRVARTWLNYIIEERCVLWWGGRGNSTEHTAFLLMQDGVLPPESGSIGRNGRVVAEQVGAQIFCEGWGLVWPAEPDKAARYAAEAASVSHDGEALHAAKVVAAMVSQAFVESDVDKLLDTATALIPSDCLIRRVIDDVRAWYADGDDWRGGWERIDERYGYERYGGNCHVVPNHAVVVHALLHGAGDFSRSLAVVNSCGWDTDSNAGNVGCIAGVLGGVAGIDAGPDWRGPVRDRIYLPSADGGGALTDAAREASAIVRYAHELHGRKAPDVKRGARFHFEFPGSVQGFAAQPAGSIDIVNVPGSSTTGTRSLALRCHATIGTAYALTPTFLTPDTLEMPPYGMVACPSLYPGQRVRARVTASSDPMACRLVVHAYDGGDKRKPLFGPPTSLDAGESADLAWTVPDTGGHPIADVGLCLTPKGSRGSTVYLDFLTWDGGPDVTFSRPADGGRMWRHAWVDAVDSFNPKWPEPFRLVQNRGTGMLIQGTREWRDYEVSADLTPHLAASVGLAARVQGLGRYYLLELAERSTARLVRVLDGREVLAETPFDWEYGTTYNLSLAVMGERITAAVDDVELSASDPNTLLTCGAVALVVKEGRSATSAVRVRPSSMSANALQRSTRGDDASVPDPSPISQEGNAR